MSDRKAPSCACCGTPYQPGTGIKTCCDRRVRVVKNGDIGYTSELISHTPGARFKVVNGKLEEVARG